MVRNVTVIGSIQASSCRKSVELNPRDFADGTLLCITAGDYTRLYLRQASDKRLGFHSSQGHPKTFSSAQQSFAFLLKFFQLF